MSILIVAYTFNNKKNVEEVAPAVLPEVHNFGDLANFIGYQPVEEDDERDKWIEEGYAKIKSPMEAFKKSFKECDNRNCFAPYTEEKAKYMGKEGMVINTFVDRSVQIKFGNGKIFEFPMESVDQNLHEPVCKGYTFVFGSPQFEI